MFKIQFQLVWQHIIDLLLVVIQSEWLIIANGLKNWLGSFQNFLLDTSSLCHCAGMTDNQTASSLWNFNACWLTSSWTFHLRPLLASCHMTGWTCRCPRVGWSEARTGAGTPRRWRPSGRTPGSTWLCHWPDYLLASSLSNFKSPSHVSITCQILTPARVDWSD